MEKLNNINKYIANFPQTLPKGMAPWRLYWRMFTGLFLNRILFIKGLKGNEVNIGSTKGRSRIIIKMKGKGNRVIISDNFNGNINLSISGSNSVFYVGKNAVLKKSKLALPGSDAVFAIGEHVGFRAGANMKSYGKLIIGDDAMLSADVLIQEYDGHPIFNGTGEEINNNLKGVIIGKHTWLCRGVKVIKGVETGKGSIIGAFSVLTKSVPNDSVAAGVPAKVIQEGDLYWSRNYSEKEMTKARAFFDSTED